jgi:glycosyltransferase involved in cell wall biosynthesis
VAPRFPFIPFEYDEESLFFDTGKAIQPLNFAFKWREKNERLKGVVHFDWKKQKYTTSGYSPPNDTITLAPLSQDKISLVFQLSRYLEKNAPISPGKKWSHSVIEAKKRKTYVFESLEEELLSTPLGLLRTIKIKQSATDSLRHSYLWFAIDKQYLLVKIAQFKQGSLIGYTLIHKLTP